MVQTRRRNSRRSSREKVGKGCICCSEETKCSNISNPKGDNDIVNKNFINQKDSYNKVTKKHSGRKSPITITGLPGSRQRRNSSSLDSRTPQECVVVVTDWLRQFQQDVRIEPATPMEDSSSEDTPSTSTSPGSSQPQEHEEQLQGAPSPVFSQPQEQEEHLQEAASPDVERPMRVPSVSSSISAPLSPEGSYMSQGGSSSTSQDDQPDTTGRPKRTPARKEKQRLASAKSRKKKKGEQDILKDQCDQLEKNNMFLEKKIEQMEIQKKRYLSGEVEYDDSDITDPEDPDENGPDGGASGGAFGGASGGAGGSPGAGASAISS